MSYIVITRGLKEQHREFYDFTLNPKPQNHTTKPRMHPGRRPESKRSNFQPQSLNPELISYTNLKPGNLQPVTIFIRPF